MLDPGRCAVNADNTYEKYVLEMEWPIKTIINDCFYEFFASDVKVHNIIDVYNINNPMKYSLNALDLYPPTLLAPKKLINGVEAPPKITLKPFIDDRKLYEKKKLSGLKVVNYIAARQKQKHL